MRTLAQGISRSDNKVAVDLAIRAGLENVANTAKRLGISSKLRVDLSLALGTSKVTLTELTRAYSAVASGGHLAWPPYGYIGLVRNGLVLHWRPTPTGSDKGYQQDHAKTLKKMLRRVVTHGTGKAANIKKGAAGKTGTSDDNRDG